MIKRLIRQAKALGACKLLDSANTLHQVVALFLSPQGREFCLKHDFPTIEAWRAADAKYDLAELGIYVDAGMITLDNPGEIAIIGDTYASVLCYGADKAQRITAMHGARAAIDARHYAVVDACADASSSVTVRTDKTAYRL